MGAYATVAVIASLIYYLGFRMNLKRAKDAGVFAQTHPDKTNFHEAASEARPDKGKFYKANTTWASFPALW